MSTTFINEFHYDNASTDAGEFVEIAGFAGTSLVGWSLAFYNGNGGTVYGTLDLFGTFADDEDGYGFLTFDYAGIQNGDPDGMALVDDQGTVVEFISYEGVILAVGGPADGQTSLDIGVAEGTSTPIGYSLQRIGSGTQASDFAFAAPAVSTPGAVNTGQTLAAPSFDLIVTEIWPGNEPGANLSADWFEITNVGTAAWIAANDGELFYDDDSADPTAADPIVGLAQIDPGESVLVVLGDGADAAEFSALWSPVIDLIGVQIATSDGSGLGQGGDAVTVFLEQGTAGDAVLDSGVILDSAAYPDADATGGQSYDVLAAAFSVAGSNGTVATLTVNDEGQAAQGSPGNGDAVVPAVADFTLELLHVADQEASTGAITDAPNFSAVLNALRAQDLGNDGIEDNTLTLSSGDAFIPGVFYSASVAAFGAGGVADILIQNELGFQAIAFGNHEFDFGTESLAGLIDGSAVGLLDNPALAGTALEGTEFTGTAFPYLSTNIDFTTDANMAPLVTAGGQTLSDALDNTVTSSVVIDVNGEQIGVVGATTPTLGTISSPGDVTLSPQPFDGAPTSDQLDALAAEIQAEVDALLAANPDMNKVVLLAHMQQISIELALAERLENVDIIVAGGSNTRLFDENDRARSGDSDQGEYPQFVTNAGGTTTAVVNTDGSYKYVGRLVIDFDAEGNIIPGSYDPDVSGAYATDQQGVEDLGATGLIDPEIQAVVNAIEAEIIATESNVFGVSDVFLNGNRNGVDTADDPDGVRSQETNLGDLTADANLAAAQAVDGTVVVSIKNGGGIRASIGQTIVPPGGTAYERVANEEILDGDGNVIKPAGGISENDIKTSLAFNNGLSLLTLTKAELVAVLEHAVGDLGGGRFPQVSGIKFSYDPDQPVGARIVNAGIFDGDDTLIAELVRDGAIVGDVTETFRIVTLNFLAGGGDGYPLDGLSDPQRVDLYDLDGNAVDDGLFTGDATFAADGTEQDALAEYLDDTYPDAANAFSEDDVGRGEDLRIQNLSYTDDTVFNDPDYGAPQPTEEITFEIAAAFAGDGGEGASEVVAHEDGLLYVTNGALGQIDIFDIAADSLVTSIPLSTLPGYDGVQSVAVKNGVVAAAIARAPVEQTVFGQTVDLSQPGFVALFDAETQTLIATVDVGVLPDQLTFSADGTTLLVAGEGEKNADSDYDDNPLGTVAIVDVTDPANPVANILDFTQFNGLEELARAAGIRIQEGVSFAADVEPEYTAIAPDGVTAFVSLQENNALAKIDIATGQILDVLPLGVTDFASDSELDAKDDDVIDIRNFANLVGFKMPDAIATFEVNGQTFIATANEGDSRDFDEDRVGDLAAAGLIDPSVDITGLERLEVSTTDGDTDGDGDIDVLHTFSSRSFSIYDADGNLVFDSGSDFERIIAEVAPERFNDDDGDAGQNRSDAKGPEPEAIAIGEIDGKLYAFIGLERDSGIMIYDVTAPENATFVNYIPPAFVDATPDGEVARQGPEVIAFISAAESTSGTAQIAVAYEISGTTVVYDLTSDVTKIHDIQGSSDLSGVAGTPTVGVDDVSPMLGQVVTIAAIVTADFQSGANGVAGSDLSGFFVQEEEFDYDGDALTSEGLFIFDDFAAGNPDVQVGDFVRITGTVGEYYGQTQISADTIVVVSSGNALPAATVVDLPTDGVMVTDAGTLVADLESVEGMVVTIPEAMTVSEMFNLDRYGEYRVSADGQPEQFTQSNAPDAQGYQDHLAEVAARSIVLDDGSTVQNPDVLEIIDGNNGVLDAGDSFRMGDTIANLTGVVQYSYDTFRLSDATGDYSQDNPRPDAPDDVGGDLKVASFNVLNFFTTLDIGSATTANGQDPRGADSQEEFDRQLAKLVNSITTIDADILGLVELENDFLAGSPGNAIEFLVDALNAELGSEVYAWVDPGTQFVGTDAISTGLIYKVDSVTQVGDAAVLVFQETSADTTFALADVLNQVASSDDRVEDFDRNRPAVAASFQDADGAVITVAVNHFKSKGDSNLQDVVEDAQAHVDGGGTTISQADIDALIADANYDQGDGQGFWNQVRVDAAGELATWLATDPTGAGDPDVLILGDLNAYAMEEPVAVLTGAGYADVAAQVLGDEASSYVFDGQTGTLDYALASASLAAQLTGATEWHINADEADAIDYNLDFGRDPALFDGDTPARTSDHDPVIVGFDLEEPDDGLTLTLVHARSHAVLAEVEDGSDIVLDDFASDDLTMLLEVDDASFRGSVLFELFQVDNGVVGDDPIVARFDNAEPYALFGDWRGHLWANDTLGEGDFMLRTTLYSRNFGRGDVVQVEETEFSITEPSAEDLIDVQFVNTHTDDILGSLVSSGSGLSFDASLSGTTADDLGILISVDSDDVESVRLTLFDEAGNELASSRDARDPYTLFGDRNWGWWGTDYRDGDVDIPSGTYRLDVELYEHNWGHDPLAEASFEFDLTVADDLLV